MNCFTVSVGQPAAAMEVYLRDKAYEFVDHSRRPCVLICPGGGYAFVADREGEPIALAFIKAGYQACVLHYSVREDESKPFLGDLPMNQAAAAIRTIRENADDWGIDSQKITVLGCSAGGHLAGSVGVFGKNERRISNAADGLCQPNAMVLCYPVITAGPFCHDGSIYNLTGLSLGHPERDAYSLEKHISPDTCPAFLWQTVTDDCVPVENVLLMANALQRQHIPYELHVYTKGQHGLSLATGDAGQGTLIDPHVATWATLAQQWLNNLGLGPGY